jgi:hypothetical protein
MACGSDKRVSLLSPDGKKEIFCDGCGSSEMAMRIGTPAVRSMETRDDYRGKSIVEGVEKMVDDRASEHFKKHELPRLIAEKGERWARDQNLIDEDGRPK